MYKSTCLMLISALASAYDYDFGAFELEDLDLSSELTVLKWDYVGAGNTKQFFDFALDADEQDFFYEMPSVLKYEYSGYSHQQSEPVFISNDVAEVQDLTIIDSASQIISNLGREIGDIFFKLNQELCAQIEQIANWFGLSDIIQNFGASLDYLVDRFNESAAEFGDVLYNRVVERFENQHQGLIHKVNWFVDIEVPFIEENLGMLFTYYSGELAQYMGHVAERFTDTIRSITKKIDDWMKHHFGEALVVNNQTGEKWGTNDIGVWFDAVKNHFGQMIHSLMADPWTVLTSDSFLEIFLTFNIVNLVSILLFL